MAIEKELLDKLVNSLNCCDWQPIVRATDHHCCDSRRRRTTINCSVSGFFRVG